MSRCQSPDHPDCRHECVDGPCVAFYEHETHLCIRGCDEHLIGIGLITAITRAGWDVKTTAEAVGISASALAVAATQVGALTQLPAAVSIIRGTADAAIAELAAEIAVHSRARAERRISFRWPNSSLSGALQTILKAVSEK
jgi:hypothetical protein